MAGESLIQFTEGVGKKVRSWQRSIGGNNVEEQFMLPAEYPHATYTIVTPNSLSIATAADHICQVMAGASLNVRIRRIHIEQVVAATAAAALFVQLFRLTTAGTGGTALTPAKLDTADGAAGATAMTLPTVKGTESTQIGGRSLELIQTQPVGGGNAPTIEWTWTAAAKGILIPAGAANGLAIKNLNARAGASVWVEIDLVETAFV